MLIKILQVDVYNEWNSKQKQDMVVVSDRWETWISTDRVTRVSFKVAFEGFAEIKCGTERLQVSVDEARRVIDIINAGGDFPLSPTEERLKAQVEQEIEDMNKHFSKPERF